MTLFSMTIMQGVFSYIGTTEEFRRFFGRHDKIGTPSRMALLSSILIRGKRRLERRKMRLIFIHGSGGHGDVWYYQKQHFLQADTPALPGHPQGKPYDSVEGYTNWLKEYIKARGYKDVVLAGHSLGSAIVITYALNYPQDLKGLILIGGGARLRVLPASLEELKAAINNPVPWQKTLPDRLKLVEPSIANMVIKKQIEIGPAVRLNDMLCCDKFDYIDKISQIKVPTLALCGSMDEMTPVKYTKFLASRIPGAKEVVIEGGTHFVFLEKPKEVNKAIEDFIKGLK